MFKQEIDGHDPSAFSSTHVLIICEVNRIGRGSHTVVVVLWLLMGTRDLRPL
jgi:hypothetical protein